MCDFSICISGCGLDPPLGWVPVREKDFSEIEKKNNICMFCYENRLTFPIYVSNKKFENSMDLLLLITDRDTSHYVYIKDFDRFMFHKTKNKNRKYFCKSCLQCFISKNVSTKHEEVCLSFNGVQSVRLEKGINEFKNYFKQIPVPFKIYADFECNLKTVESYDGSYFKTCQDHVSYSFAFKLFCGDDKFNKTIVVFRGKNVAYEFIKAIFKEFEYCKRVMKKHFNKNLIMSEEEVEQFRSSKTCWICEKLIDNDDGKVRDHCQVTGKFRGAAHWSCNIVVIMSLVNQKIFCNI